MINLKQHEYLFVFNSAGKQPLEPGSYVNEKYQTIIVAPTAEEALKKLEKTWSCPSIIYANKL